MVMSTMLLPVIAFVLAVAVGRIGTIIKDDMRKDSHLTKKDIGHASYTQGDDLVVKYQSYLL